MRLIREPSTPNTTFGILFIDGYFQCFTLENTEKIIPAGTYPITFYDSPRNKCIVPLLNNVLGRSEIEMHVANWPTELEGCIAVGNDKDATMLLNSREAFQALMIKIGSATNIVIKIEDWA